MPDYLGVPPIFPPELRSRISGRALQAVDDDFQRLSAAQQGKGGYPQDIDEYAAILNRAYSYQLMFLRREVTRELDSEGRKLSSDEFKTSCDYLKGFYQKFMRGAVAEALNDCCGVPVPSEKVRRRLLHHLHGFLDAELNAYVLDLRMRTETGEPGFSVPKKKSKRGRKPDTDSVQDKRICEAWETGSYKTHADLAKALKTTEREVKLAKDRHRKRPANAPAR